MHDHPFLTVDEATASVEKRRLNVASSAASLRERLTAERLMADGSGGVRRGLGQIWQVVGGNPAAVALILGGLAWLMIGRRQDDGAASPHFDPESRWEGEGGTVHPEYETPVDQMKEVDRGKRASLLDSMPTWISMQRMAGDYPVQMALVMAALGGVLAARLPATEIEKTALAGAKGRLMDEAKRLVEEGTERVKSAAAELKGGLGEDMRSAKDHVVGAVEQVVRKPV